MINCYLIHNIIIISIISNGSKKITSMTTSKGCLPGHYKREEEIILHTQTCVRKQLSYECIIINMNEGYNAWCTRNAQPILEPESHAVGMFCCGNPC